MKNVLRFMLLGLAGGLAWAQTPSGAPADLPENPAPKMAELNPALPTIFVAGDSTAARNGKDKEGWGVPFPDYFDPTKVNVANRARGGRSSRTFITEGLWDQLLAEVKPGDFVLIQFGQNDGGAINEEPPGSTQPLRARGTLPGLGDETREIDNVITKKHEVVHTFGWYVSKMIADVQAKQATPILLSLTVHNTWHDGKVERGVGNYRGWIHELADRHGIEFVDLTRIVADLYQQLGVEKVKAYFPSDYVHTNLAGAEFNAAGVVAGLRGLKKSHWDALLSEKGKAVVADPIGWLNLPEPVNPDLPTVFLIGDSTVRNGRGDGADGQWGWGDPIVEYFDRERVNVVNRAIGGLSSRTFLTQGHWSRALMLAKPGDFVLMQFGHNDNGPLNDNSRARGTIKGIGDETEEIDNQLTHQHEIVHSYGWYLRQYVREAKAHGLTPIVLSPVPRKEWANGKIVRPKDSYPQWAKRVAEQENVAFVDLYDRIARYYDQLGSAKVDALFADPHTHTSRLGAEVNANVVMEGLRELPGAPLAKLMR